MTSIAGAELSRTTELSRRLAVLPTVAAAAAVGMVVAAGPLTGLTGSEWGRAMLWVAAGLVLVAMVSGFEVGHYLGLALLVAASRIAVDEPTPPRLLVLIVFVLAIHETGRFSLDARRPARFAPGFVRRYAATAAAIGFLVVVLAVAMMDVDGLALPPILVPVGLALASLPLVTRRLIQSLGPTLRSSLSVRLAVGLVVLVLTMTAAVMGAQARTGIVNDRSPAAPPTTVRSQPDDAAGAGSGRQADPEETLVERIVSIVLLALAIVVAGLLYAAFRRPEESFELDELETDVDQLSLGLARPGEADLDDYSAAVDERELAELLDELLLDISSEPDPGRAIRFGFATIERRLSQLGIDRNDSETEQELLARALPVLGKGEAAMVTLTDLFEHARFGRRPITEPMRGEAVEAVEALRRATVAP